MCLCQVWQKMGKWNWPKQCVVYWTKNSGFQQIRTTGKIQKILMLPPKILEGHSFQTCHSAAKFHPNRPVSVKVLPTLASSSSIVWVICIWGDCNFTAPKKSWDAWCPVITPFSYHTHFVVITPLLPPAPDCRLRQFIPSASCATGEKPMLLIDNNTK